MHGVILRIIWLQCLLIKLRRIEITIFFHYSLIDSLQIRLYNDKIKNHYGEEIKIQENPDKGRECKVMSDLG